MKKNWFTDKVEKLSSVGGYQKPELHQDTLKLDSNEKQSGISIWDTSYK